MGHSHARKTNLCADVSKRHHTYVSLLIVSAEPVSRTQRLKCSAKHREKASPFTTLFPASASRRNAHIFLAPGDAYRVDHRRRITREVNQNPLLRPQKQTPKRHVLYCTSSFRRPRYTHAQTRSKTTNERTILSRSEKRGTKRQRACRKTTHRTTIPFRRTTRT